MNKDISYTVAEAIKSGEYCQKNKRIDVRTQFGWEKITKLSALTKAEISSLSEKFGEEVIAEIGIVFDAEAVALLRDQERRNCAAFDARTIPAIIEKNDDGREDAADGFLAGLANCQGFAESCESQDDQAVTRIGSAMVRAGYGWPSITPVDVAGKTDVEVLMSLGCPKILAEEILA